MCYYVSYTFHRTGYVLSTTYKPLLISEGGLEIPLNVKFEHEDENILDQMKRFVNEKYEDIVDGVLVESEDENELCQYYSIVSKILPKCYRAIKASF